LDAAPCPNGSGTAPSKAVSEVIRIGRKRNRQTSQTAFRGDKPRCWACKVKSTIMIAFFLTIPISKMMPIIPSIYRSSPQSINVSSAPNPADGKVEMIVSG